MFQCLAIQRAVIPPSTGISTGCLLKAWERQRLGVSADRIPQLSRPAGAKLEDCMMRKMLFAAIATLAVAFANLAAASEAPHIGDGTALDKQSTVLFYGVGGG
jgi:hypothetical protein